MAWLFGAVSVLLSVGGWNRVGGVEYKMDGGAYIVYSLDSKETSSHAESQLMLQILFRTAQPSGLLVHGRGTTGDFFTVELVRGKLRYASVFDRANSKPGYYDVIVGDDLGDDQWHQIDMERRNNHVIIKLDRTRRYLIPRNSRKSLHINLDVSVGGLVVKPPADPSLPRVTLTGTVFKGCMEDVTYDRENILQATKQESKHIKVIGSLQPKCSEDQEFHPPATLTTSSSFIQFNISRQENLNLKFKFRTFEHTGVLIHYDLDNGSLIVELVRGKLCLNFSSKFLNIQANLSPNTRSLANGLWHKFELNMTDTEITVQVNDKKFQKLLNGSQEVVYPSMNAKLRIGTAHSGKSSLIGCVKEIDLNGREKVVVSSAMTENVDVNKCFLIDLCFSNPCYNNGGCLQFNNTAQCDCLGTGHQGVRCEETTMSPDPSGADTGSPSPLRPTPTFLISSFIKESSLRLTNSLVNQPPTKLLSTVSPPLDSNPKSVSRKVVNFTLSYTSKHVTLSSSGSTISATITRFTNSQTHTNAFPVGNFQPTTSLASTTSITPASSVTDNFLSSVQIIFPTTKQTTLKNDQRIIIIEKRSEVTTVGLKTKWLMYLLLCVVVLLVFSLIVIIITKIGNLPLCGFLKRFTHSEESESLSRQDSMELDQQDANEDIEEGKKRCAKSRRPSSFDDSGIDHGSDSSTRNSADVNKDSAAQRDSEIWLDCEVTILENSNETFKKGFLVLQEGPPLFTQKTFGWSVESSETANQPHPSFQGEAGTSRGRENYAENSTEISTNAEDGVDFVTSPEHVTTTTRYHQLRGEPDSSSLENVFVDVK